ncbi:L-threonylcarbamoyladenylate synthase [Marinomonas epiphytica]
MKRIQNENELAQLLAQGAVIAYPTEAVWGLGCDPFNAKAVRRILEIKSRPEAKGLILIGGHKDHLAPWTQVLDHDEAERLISPTDRPTSWVVPDTSITPSWVRGEHKSVAIRLSKHQPVQALCAAFGGVLVSTSANPAGLEPAMTPEEVQAYFGDKIDAIYDAPLGQAAQPSQVQDLITGKVFR